MKSSLIWKGQKFLLGWIVLKAQNKKLWKSKVGENLEGCWNRNLQAKIRGPENTSNLSYLQWHNCLFNFRTKKVTQSIFTVVRSSCELPPYGHILDKLCLQIQYFHKTRLFCINKCYCYSSETQPAKRVFLWA